MNYDFKAAFTDVTKDPNFWSTILVMNFACLLFLVYTVFTGVSLFRSPMTLESFSLHMIVAYIVFVLFVIFASGYFMTYFKSLLFEGVAFLPSISKNSGHYLSFGIRMLGSAFVLNFLVGIPLAIVTFIPFLGPIISFLGSVAFAFVMPAIYINYLKDPKLASMLDIKSAYYFIKDNLVEYTTCMVVLAAWFVLYYIAFFVLTVTVVGLLVLPAAIVYTQFVSMSLTAQMYKNTLKIQEEVL